MPTKKCSWCEAEFLTEIKRDHFCSDACRVARKKEMNRQKQARWRAAHPEQYREINRKNNANWVRKNPERAKELGREKAARHYKKLRELKQ